MGTCDLTNPPNNKNVCTDYLDDDNNNENGNLYDYPGTCYVGISSSTIDGESYTSTTAQEALGYYCNTLGGNGPIDPTGIFAQPEMVGGYLSNSVGSCSNNNLQNGSNPGWNYAVIGGAAGIDHCNDGQNGYCKRVLTTGDPLICALRDYQCNGNSDITSKYCFSDKNTNNTCNQNYRAPDTDSSFFLLNQFCLGNIPGAFKGGSGPQDFLELWTDPTNPNDDKNWIIDGTPGNTYLLNQNLNTSCSLNPKTGVPNADCNLYSYPGATGATGTYPPPPWASTLYNQVPESYEFNSGLPPCQQIFWRVLYGNNPTFKQNNWKISGEVATCPDGSTICPETSILPQTAACGSIPFAGEPSPSGLAGGKAMLRSVVNKYYNSGGNLLDPITITKDFTFVNWLYSVCETYPGLCKEILEAPNGICAAVTPEDFKANPFAMNWCGCYMTDKQYEKYQNDFGITKQCTPYCNAADVIPLTDVNNVIQQCNQSICLMDNVTITLAKSRVNGPLTLNQVCSSCSPTSNSGLNYNTNTSDTKGSLNPYNYNTSNTYGSKSVGVTSGANNNTQQTLNINTANSCQCILDNFTLTGIGTTFNGGINLSQACNGNAKCYKDVPQSDGTNLKVEIDCHSDSISQNDTIIKAEQELIKKAGNISSAWVILLFIILVAAIILIWILLDPRKIPESDKVFTKKTTIQGPPVIINNIPQQNMYNPSYSAPRMNKPTFF